jgi:hypothetical protein
MKLRRLALLTALTSLGLLATAGATPAVAAPVWNLAIHHNQTNFTPGGEGEYWFDVSNVGGDDSSGPITLTLELPTGLTGFSASNKIDLGGQIAANWSCPGVAGASTVVCTSTETIPAHRYTPGPILVVKVAPGLEGQELTSTATLSGGGVAEAPPAAGCPPLVAACDSEPTRISATPAPFGILASSFQPDFFEADGVTPVRQSGAHPFVATFPFDFNTVDRPTADKTAKRPTENVRNLRVDLPAGFLGNPSAVGECQPGTHCPPDSQVGTIEFTIAPLAAELHYGPHSAQVFNMAHPKGVITDLSFDFAGNPVHIKASLDPARNYAIKTTVSSINESLPIFHQKLTVWGVPADSRHDSERCGITSPSFAKCPSPGPRKPFLTVPFQCGVENSMKLSRYDSWENTGVFGPDVEYPMPGQQTGCEEPRFEPDVSLEPTGKQANTATGLDVSIHVPQNENPNGLGTPPVKSTVVTLPKGMTVSPSFADGLEGCSEAQIGLGTNDPVACPDNSRIGEVELSTPLLPKPIVGSMYLAKQGANPFGSLLAVYLAVHDTEERGVLVKVPGKIELDPVTGQITTSFDDLPQFPFEDLTLKFRSGPRAPLINPPTCGTHAIAVEMASYAQPDDPVEISNAYGVNEGPGGGGCQQVASQRPFDPQLLGGTLNPLAGAFSPMNLRVSRTDAEQELSGLEGIAPPGLSASLRGVGRCSDAQIAAAAARSQPGQGALELASPSCPANSQVGTLEAGAGAGAGLIYVPGKIYMAGPYKGAPLSGVAIVPAIAGPVDLGNVVVRAPAYVDPVAAQVRLVTDQLPQIVNGVLIRVRDIRVHLDRPEFMLNPTSCAQKRLGATLFSTEGATKQASNRFQVGDCASLGFAPRLGIKLKGGTKRGGHPALKAVVSPRDGDANFANAVVTLPRSAFLDQAHIRTICTRVQYAAEKCPPGAQYGFAKAWTPLLDEPLEGPVYLRSSDHKLPDLVAALHGIVDVDLTGRIDSFKGGIRSSFEDIPDVPVSRFVLEMQGGRKGLVVNSRNLCAGKNKAAAKLDGQNGKGHDFSPLVKPSCRGKAHKRPQH